MAQFKTEKFRALLKELGQDPKIKAALEKVTEKSKIGHHVRSLKGFLPLVGKLSKFGGRRTLAVTETLTLIILLFEVSVLIKQNVFDRPEVKKFFTENWGAFQKKVAAMYLFVSNHVHSQLKRTQKTKD
jgi:hypothetical protein